MNKTQKIIIGIYVAVCLLILFALPILYIKFDPYFRFLDAFAWGEITGDYSRIDSLLIKMLLSIVVSWIILATPAIIFYKIYGKR